MAGAKNAYSRNDDCGGVYTDTTTVVIQDFVMMRHCWMG